MERRSVDGIPYLGPHGALFYKAKSSRPKDQADFDATAPTLEPDEHEWLVETMRQDHPEHPWLAALTSPR